MPKYSEEFKEKIVQKMMPPNSQSVAQISRDTGVCGPTLYTWKNGVTGSVLTIKHVMPPHRAPYNRRTL